MTGEPMIVSDLTTRFGMTGSPPLNTQDFRHFSLNAILFLLILCGFAPFEHSWVLRLISCHRRYG